MAQPLLDSGRAAAQPTQTDLTLDRVIRAWKAQPRGNAFGLALVAWLRSSQNKHTLRVYSHCVLELFEWFEKHTKHIPTPDLVLRDHTNAYEQWLTTRTQNLTRYRIEMAGDRKLDQTIYDIVAESPGIGIDGIRLKLSAKPEFVTTVARGGDLVRMLIVDERCTGGLATRLADLVRYRTLDRTPTLEQARRGEVAELGGAVWDVPPSVFKYRAPEITTPTGDQRAAGNATRLAVLASFWGYLAKSGENAPGAADPLLKVNIWLPLVKRTRERASTHQAMTRASKTPTSELYERLVAVTFYSTHGDKAREMAHLAINGQHVPAGTGRARFDNLRDRVLLLIMLQAGGPRSEEVGRMRRGDLVGGVLTIHGKRDKYRQVPVPPAAIDALEQLTLKLKKMLEHQHKYTRRLRAEDLLTPTAPLIPAIRYWGANAAIGLHEKGLSRQGISQRLQSLAVVAGIDPNGEDMKRIHPHGVRRLYAKTEIAAGTPLNVIQANMGHASGAMVLHYAEETDPAALRGKAFEPAPPLPTLPQTTSTVGIPLTEYAKTQPDAPPAMADIGEMADTPTQEFEPVEPEVVRVIRQERRAAPVPALGQAVAMSPSERWQRLLRRPLTAEETTALGACPGQPGEPGRMACEIYSVDWGEPGNRTRLIAPKDEVAALETQYIIAQGQSSAPRTHLETFAQTQRLGHLHAGIESGLVWWGGTDGKLEMAMPVPSPRQIGECEEEDNDNSPLCEALSSLWWDWTNEPTEAGGEEALRTRGPTAAAALVMWVAEMLDTSAQAEAVIARRGGTWVPADEPWERTALGQVGRGYHARMMFREHDKDRIVDWFKEFAWQYRMSRGREEGMDTKARPRRVITEPIHVPEWYGLPDPIAALPAADRAELLDFISVMKGDLVLHDETPRFDTGTGLSRSDVSRALSAMREYEETLTQKRAAQKEELSDTRATDVALLKQRAELAAEHATGAFVELGVDDFDLINEVAQRKRKNKFLDEKEDHGAFYLRMLEKAFGPKVASDPIVSLAAKMRRGDGEKQVPLSGYYSQALRLSYDDLMRIDWTKQTIEHEESFKRRFAEDASMNSECVARRMARELWELWRSGKETRAFSRRDELIDLITSLASARVPCPMVQEREIRALRGEHGTAGPVYEQWRRHRTTTEPDSLEAIFPGALTPGQRAQLEREHIGEQEQELAEQYKEATDREQRIAQFGKKDGTDYNANPQAQCYRYTRNVARLLPSPIQLLRCAMVPAAM